MVQPIGYEDNTNRVSKLKKSLYRLKQAPRCWNSIFTEFVCKFNLKSSEADAWVFVNNLKDNTIILAVFVGDGLIAAQNEESIEQLLTALITEFQMITESLNYFLGINIYKLKVFINQSNYVINIIQKRNLNNAKKLSIPISRSNSIG